MFDKDQARKMIIGRKNVNQESMRKKNQERKKSGEKRKQGRMNIGTTKKGKI